MSQPIMAFGFFRIPIHFVVPADKKKTKYLQMTKSLALCKQAIDCLFLN